MAKDITKGILGDIRPEPNGPDTKGRGHESIVGSEHDEPMQGGSRHDESQHPGSRNYRQGTGATGGDIGNRPE